MRIFLSLGIAAGLALLAGCGPDVEPSDIPSCAGYDTTDLTCDNASETYNRAVSGADGIVEGGWLRCLSQFESVCQTGSVESYGSLDE